MTKIYLYFLLVYFQVKAKEKADLMLQLLGYPEWVASEEGITEYYNGVSPFIQVSKLSNLLWVNPTEHIFTH